MMIVAGTNARGAPMSRFAVEFDISNYGDVVAARIGAVAAADSILVSEAVADALGGAAPIGAVRARELKGIAEPVGVAAVEWRLTETGPRL